MKEFVFKVVRQGVWTLVAIGGIVYVCARLSSWQEHDQKMTEMLTQHEIQQTQCLQKEN